MFYYFRSVFLFSFVLLALLVSRFSSAVMVVDFDESMGINERERYDQMLRDGDNSNHYISFYRELYNNNINTPKSKHIKIPRILHQIWIGPAPFPALYREYANTCKTLNPGWEYKLWTNDDVEEILADAPQYKDMYEKYGKYKQYSGQKDILEFLILHKYGGLFLDADIKCLKSMDELHYKYDFYSALEPGNYWSKIPIMTNAVVGSKPHNQIFADTLSGALKSFNGEYREMNSGFRYFLRAAMRKLKGRNEADGIKLPDQRLILMMQLSKNLIAKNDVYNDLSIVFPATYFNPVVPGKAKYSIINHFKYLTGTYKNKGKTFTEIKPETIAVQDFFD